MLLRKKTYCLDGNYIRSLSELPGLFGIGFSQRPYVLLLTFLILSQIYTIFPRTNKEKSAPGLAGRIISLTKFKKL